MSSANILQEHVLRQLGRSLTYRMNSSGPRTDHCGTPLSTDDQKDRTPLTLTDCILFVRKDSIQDRSLPLTPIVLEDTFVVVLLHFFNIVYYNTI